MAKDQRMNDMQMQQTSMIAGVRSVDRKSELGIAAFGSNRRNPSPIRRIEYPACPVGPKGMKTERMFLSDGIPNVINLWK